MKDKFEEKWKDFCEFETSTFNGVDKLYYIVRQDLFLFSRGLNQFVRISIVNEELKKKMISLSIIKGNKGE